MQFFMGMAAAAAEAAVEVMYAVSSGLAKTVAGHQGLQLQKVVGPDEKL